jgi:hypothetical protein
MWLDGCGLAKECALYTKKPSEGKRLSKQPDPDVLGAPDLGGKLQRLDPESFSIHG